MLLGPGPPAALVEQAADAGELVLALDGTTVDDAAIAAAPDDSPPVAVPPSSISAG